MFSKASPLSTFIPVPLQLKFQVFENLYESTITAFFKDLPTSEVKMKVAFHLHSQLSFLSSAIHPLKQGLITFSSSVTCRQ